MYVATSWGKKMNFNSCANMAGFCMDSHICVSTGQFLQKGVHIDKENKLLVLPGRASIPVYQSHVWSELQIADYKDKSCWRPEVGHTVTEGENYDYITDHVTGTKFKFSASKLQK